MGWTKEWLIYGFWMGRMRELGAMGPVGYGAAWLGMTLAGGRGLALGGQVIPGRGGSFALIDGLRESQNQMKTIVTGGRRDGARSLP